MVPKDKELVEHLRALIMTKIVREHGADAISPGTWRAVKVPAPILGDKPVFTVARTYKDGFTRVFSFDLGKEMQVSPREAEKIEWL